MPPDLPPRNPSPATPALPADGKRSKQEEGSVRMLEASDTAPGWAPLLSMVPGLRLMVGLVIAAVVILGLYVGRDLLLPLALAALLGFLLDPAVSRLKRWGLPRMLAVLLVVSVALGGIGAGALYVGSKVTELSAELPTYQNTIRQKLRNLKGYFNGPSIFDGAVKVFSTVETEIGISSPATRTTGSSRKSKHSSVMRAASSAPTPAVIAPSETTMARPVFSTSARIVSKSSGFRVRRSITVASNPCAANIRAASSA